MKHSKIISNTEVTLHTEPFHYLVIKNLWTDKERTEMFNEMLRIEESGALQNPEYAGSATDDKTGRILKHNKSGFVGEMYRNPELSSILKYKGKALQVIFGGKVVEGSWFFNGIHASDDTCLISYYEEDSHYKPHRDQATITTVSWFFKEPKKFKGGEITFTDYDLTFEVTNDLTIVFPSNIRHEVSKVSIEDGFRGRQYGRFCMSQFIY